VQELEPNEVLAADGGSRRIGRARERRREGRLRAKHGLAVNVQRRLIVGDARDHHGEDVPPEAPDEAVGLWRLIEALDLSLVDRDADAEKRRAIDEHTMLATRRLGDRPFRYTCHRPEIIVARGRQPGSGRVSPSGST